MADINQKELIWVKKEFAEQYLSLNEDSQDKAFQDYMHKQTDDIKLEYQTTLEIMKEDAAMFRGLMIEVRKEFQKFTNEHMSASYELWENYNKELPRLKMKVDEFLKELRPITKELSAINTEIGKINTWDIDRLVKTLESVISLDERSKEMLAFLMGNFKKEK